MANKKSPSQKKPEKKVRLGKGPYAFVMGGKTCRGTIQVVNNSDEWSEIAELVISSVKLKTLEGEPLKRMKLNARVGPHRTQPVKSYFQLDPATPPGKYAGHLEYEGQKEELTVFVPENRNIEIMPTRITLCGHPGEKLRTTVVVKNLGNTLCQLPSSVYLALADGNNYEISALAALKEVGEKGYEAVRNHFMKAISELQIDEISVKINAPGIIEPGQVDLVELELVIPENARPDITYQGSAALFNIKLRFAVQVLSEAAVVK